MKLRLLALALPVCFLGCSRAPGSLSNVADAGPASASTPAITPMASSESQEIPLQILDWESTQNLVQQNAGKVVVIDVWATYCPPCIAEFPNLVKLHRRHGSKIACISVSADFDGTGDPVESYRPRVLTFLTKQQATFTNVLLATDTETLFTKKIVHQSIPIVMVFDRSGQLAAEFPDPKNPDEFTYEQHVFPVVEKLIATE